MVYEIRDVLWKLQGVAAITCVQWRVVSKVMNTIFVWLIMISVVCGHVEATPRLSSSQVEIMCGKTTPLSEQKYTVGISNNGDTPLEIHRVRACCGAKASISINTIAPRESATLTVSLGKIAKSGPFRKQVTLYTNDPTAPVIEIPVVGEVSEANIEEQENEVVIHNAPVVAGTGNNGIDTGVTITSTSESTARDIRLSLRLPVILLAGLVDGFNPCAFSIIIVLAGILAVGGRLRKARLWGGISFCVASYVTYMAMGLGLVSAIRAASELGLVVDIVFAFLAASLFALSALSFRDAVNYHRKRIPAAITLQLPDKVKAAIRRVAQASWSGPAVVGTGLVCGVLVTLLDSLCTGQVYVPVLALLAREKHSVRALVLLALYNLAFIAPLIAVFALAAKGTDSKRMSRWSKRNVVPSKIFLGLIFAVLGYLLLPDFSASTARKEIVPASEKSDKEPIPATRRQKHPEIVDSNSFSQDVDSSFMEHMTDDQLSEGNEFLDALVRNPNPSNEAIKDVIATIYDRNRDPNWRNYCLQIIPELIMNIGVEDEQSDPLWEVLEFGLTERNSVLPGTAILGLDRLNENGHVSDSDLINFILVIAADENTLPGNRITALRLGAERGVVDILPISLRWAKEGEDEYLRMATISAIGELGSKEDILFLKSLLPANNRDESQAIGKAIHAIADRD